MPEKFSSIDRVVGDINETEKERILSEQGERFDDQIFEELKDSEREKTKEELKIISLVNEVTNRVRRKYDAGDFNIPPANIHIIEDEKWPREKSNAFFKSNVQGIALREKPSNITFMKTVFHEMLHFKSYGALQMTNEENPELDEYRMGLTVRTRDGKIMYFKNLNEAITEEMTAKYARQLLNNPLFTKDIEQTEKITRENPYATSVSGGTLFNFNTFYAQIESKKSWRETVGQLLGFQKKSIRILTEQFGYNQERAVLNVLINKIFERNQDKFKNKAEVFEVFEKGMITGNILPMGRLIENTFSNGTLRKIGELDENIEAQKDFVNSL
ncbi:MAG: hypothetical protein EXS48_03080 [Candidatus Staskawiczbacteria bacterium]|nr:hypothetical protein [Candidatus Staskawiczbacteria bacterium]